MPRVTARKVEPKAMISEFTKRGQYFDGPTITMERSRAIWSQTVCGGAEALDVLRRSGGCAW